MDKDILGFKEKRYRDDNFLYRKYFIDLKGEKFFSKKKKEQEYKDIESLNPYINYQRHPELAEAIVMEDEKLRAIYKELKIEFPKLIRNEVDFLIHWGYVLVDLCSLTSDNYFIYDSYTIPGEIIEEINKEDPYGFLQKYDAGLGITEEDWEKLEKLHYRILEERSKLENKKISNINQEGDPR